MEEVKETTEYIMAEEDQRIRNKMLKVLDKPIPLQRFMYYQDGNLPKFYNATVVVDKEDRISIIKKSYELKIGTNGLFIKEKPSRKSGITYHKKGRSSARLRYWNGYTHKRERYDLLKQLASIVNSDTAGVLDNDVIERLGTQGMHGYILAGNIGNLTEAMEYYIRYSLRGTGVKQEHADSLYTFLSCFNDPHGASNLLRVLEDPNAVLAKISNDDSDTSVLIQSMATTGGKLIPMALSTGEKIDWLAPGFTPKKEADRLEKKIQKFHGYLRPWTEGPILWDKREEERQTAKSSAADFQI